MKFRTAAALALASLTAACGLAVEPASPDTPATDDTAAVERRAAPLSLQAQDALKLLLPQPADDLVDEENARTEGQREKVRTWYFKTLLPCLEPDGRLFIVGTRYHFLDLYGLLIKNELAGKHQVIRAIAEDGTTPWPEKFPLAWLEERRRQMGSAIFATQYQNDVELMKGDIFREAWFRYYEEPPDWSECEHWIGCDPAATKAEVVLSGRKAETDWWTIVVGARRRENSKDSEYGREVYVREVWRGRVTKQEYLDRLKAMNERYKPRDVVVESVAAQEYLAQDLEKLMPVHRLERTKDKVSRAYLAAGVLRERAGPLPGPAPPARRGRLHGAPGRADPVPAG